MRFKYITKSENGDATTTYDLEGSFPVKFLDFLEWVMERESSFRVSFYLNKNKIHERENIEVSKEKDGKCYIAKDKKALLEEIKNIDVTGCWANGGWGQMSYYCSLAEEPEKAEPTQTPERKELLQLIHEASKKCDKTECMTCPYHEKDCEDGLIADYLLSNGVTVPLAADEGNEVEQADWQTSMMQHFTKVE